MVKSPGTSPDRKKAKIDVYPMVVKDPQAREINAAHLLSYTTALSGFEIPTEDQLATVDGDCFRHHPNEEVEQYFRASAQWGVPAIAWNIVRPAFLWKLEFCITEFMHVEKVKKVEAAKLADPVNENEKTEKETPAKEKMSILGHKINLIKTTPVVFNTEESMEFVLDKAKSFDGFPFTWQRLCELFTEPMKHYNTIDKFLRAIEKVINVVTTINEHGARSFGDWDVPHSHQQNLENLFFGAVDEVEMMELEKLKHENEEPLDMSQKSMPAPRAPPRSPSSSPKAMSPGSSPKAISPVSSPKAGLTATQNQSPKKEEPKEEKAKEELKDEAKEDLKDDVKETDGATELKDEPMEMSKEDQKEESKEPPKPEVTEETKAEEPKSDVPAVSEAADEEMPEHPEEKEKKDEEMECTPAAAE
ncbi:hypothetical protein B9Z55_002510 [Caenorhabditis nigoni]|uniref:Uncharacterized protein n=1 Tax=Caenorhabditis nigoni TaxID=1611254 RepID=A0A2G5VKU6_9PELO|nr:hypothetical protein B9Z55_002510 [Caenorhabditis nigoni]